MSNPTCGIVDINYQLSFLERVVINILKCGPIPEHIAFIMDGNRRYGKQEQLNNRDSYVKCIKVCSYIHSISKAIGVKQVTGYAFSIANFNRTNEEVSVILEDLLPKLLENSVQDVPTYKKIGIRIRVIGNFSLLSEATREGIAKLNELTKDNKEFTVNIALAYSSWDEISHAIRSVVKQVNSNEINSRDIDVEAIRRQLYLPEKVDCLVRTSGAFRLSNFLLWQIEEAQVKIIQPLWPESGFLMFMQVILNYQKNYAVMKSNGGE